MPVRWPLFAGAVLAGAMVMPGTVGAQTQAEVRGGLTVGSHSASAAALDIAPAVSFDVVLKRQVTPSIAVFGGFFRTAFGCEEGFCKDRNLTVVGNHGALGGEWGGSGRVVAGGGALRVDAGGDGRRARGTGPWSPRRGGTEHRHRTPALPSRRFLPVDVRGHGLQHRPCHRACARPGVRGSAWRRRRADHAAQVRRRPRRVAGLWGVASTWRSNPSAPCRPW